MSTSPHRTGTIQSGDVTLFYRRFGTPGATPIVILHGANYYDSYDWIEVAGALGHDREVAVWDTRGFGASSWSPSKDYSYDAIMADVTAVLGHLGWPKAVVMGHSLGGSYAILFAARCAAQTAGLILVDHCPGKLNPEAASVGNAAKIFPSIEAALADTSREKSVAKGSPQWSRLEMAFKAVDGGFVFRRDPDYGNRVPVQAGWTSRLTPKPADGWSELAAVKAPAMVLRGIKSDRYTDAALAKLAGLPHIKRVDIDCGHDVAGAAPAALIEAVSGFLAERSGKAA